MSGETDLETMLAGLTVELRPGRYTMVSLDDPVPLGAGVEALISEGEGITSVTTVELATERGWYQAFEAAWLTLQVHSSVEAVGLTVAVAATLAERSIACNVLAGYFHDHLLVPRSRAEEAVAGLESLSAST
ncbi:MAG: ACT domain-containing protein [Candidatus Microthrix sp.]|uniref:ACT domain-containing protein n=1 Tax=Candidatus Neomicrothrix subdominans TaxID=2954438 RepID=A0A936NE89_9ACTN|nr:ACT domain-containing protein [Candidatus Microthrix subdominans]